MTAPMPNRSQADPQGPLDDPEAEQQRPALLRVEEVSKTFILHTQGGSRIPVLAGVSLTVLAGECVALHGPSGSGKSTLLRALVGNYRVDAGRILVRHMGGWLDIVHASPREILAARRLTLGHVSQFLRVIPRVPARDIVAEPCLMAGMTPEAARARAEELLERLNLPERLWSLAPATFSGGEQQRVNIARGFAVPRPVLLLDEPTASLDAANREAVFGLVEEALDNGAAVVGIFHDAEARDRLADRLHVMSPPDPDSHTTPSAA